MLESKRARVPAVTGHEDTNHTVRLVSPGRLKPAVTTNNQLLSATVARLRVQVAKKKRLGGIVKPRLRSYEARR